MTAVKSESRFISITLQPEGYQPDTGVGNRKEPCVKMRQQSDRIFQLTKISNYMIGPENFMKNFDPGRLKYFLMSFQSNLRVVYFASALSIYLFNQRSRLCFFVVKIHGEEQLVDGEAAFQKFRLYKFLNEVGMVSGTCAISLDIQAKSATTKIGSQ